MALLSFRLNAGEFHYFSIIALGYRFPRIKGSTSIGYPWADLRRQLAKKVLMETRDAHFAEFFRLAITLGEHKLCSPPIMLVIITKTELYQQTLNFRRHFLRLMPLPPSVALNEPPKNFSD